LLPLIDYNTLYRLQWGGGSDKKRAEGSYDKLVKEEFEPLLQELVAEAKREGFLKPTAIYGYFPCVAQGDEVVVLDAQDFGQEINRFSFPRQPGGELLCLADYFSQELRQGQPDVLPLQVVTAGAAASAYCDRLTKAGDYSRAYFIHGFASSIAEAVADYIQHRVRRELGIDAEQGKRYSWGYPACPDLAEQTKLFELMPVTQETGVSITEGYQLDPEQSTAALVVHHSAAKYYSTIDRETLAAVR
jgi:5-methyltetrahydrofolate--homocysteine methyltransferase